MQRYPVPTEDDFVVELNADRKLLCDADVHPVRDQVQSVIDGCQPPFEWLTLHNSAAIVAAYRQLRDAVTVYRETKRKLAGSSCWISVSNASAVRVTPVEIAQRVTECRWNLVAAVVEGLYGDAKYRAASLWNLRKTLLVRMARRRKIKRYSRMRKHELVYALVADGFG